MNKEKEITFTILALLILTLIHNEINLSKKGDHKAALIRNKQLVLLDNQFIRIACSTSSDFYSVKAFTQIAYVNNGCLARNVLITNNSSICIRNLQFQRFCPVSNCYSNIC